MRERRHTTRRRADRPARRNPPAAVVIALSAVLAVQGCFDPVYPQLDREARVMEALGGRDARALPPSPLTPGEAVRYALANNLDAKVAEIETAYFTEAAVAARRRLLPSLTLRYSMEHSNHPGARWSESTRTGNQSLESSYSADPNSRQGDVGLVWNLIDFGVGYLKTRQQGERIRHSEQQRRRVRQQVVLDVLSHYWRASAAAGIAREAEDLRRELESQAEAVRDSVEMRILSGAEGARRELAVQGGLAELEQWRRVAVQSKLELGRVMGCGSAQGFRLADFPDAPPEPPRLFGDNPDCLQIVALERRPELFQQDGQERIAVDEARIALLQMAPNANLSLNLHDDPDRFLEWNNWMTVGARVSWNLFNIPARLSERRLAKLQEETAKRKGLAMAAAIMAQVGIAFSEWRLAHEYAATLADRAAVRQRLVDALAAGEKDGQTRPGEVLQERVRLLADRAASLRASAEARVAGARLANALGLDVDDRGRLLWDTESDLADGGAFYGAVREAEARARELFPEELSGLTVLKRGDGRPYHAPAPSSAFEPAAEWREEPPEWPAFRRRDGEWDRQTPDADEPAAQTAYILRDAPYERREEYHDAEPAGGRGGYDEETALAEADREFCPDVMRDLANTAYAGPAAAPAPGERTRVRILIPKIPGQSRVDIPEEIQAQRAPDLEGLPDLGKPPAAVFSWPEGDGAPGLPPITAPTGPERAEPPRPFPGYDTENVPPASAVRPPATDGVRSLRPPEKPRQPLVPPITTPSPNDFGGAETARLVNL